MENRVEAFTSAVIELNRYLQKVKDVEMRQFGLRGSHAMCLYYLGQYSEGLTAAQLAELCKEDKAAISRCLRQLAEKNLITHEQPKDKRAYRMRIFLTVDGKILTQKVNACFQNAFASVGGALTDAQREVFYGALQLIVSGLSQYLCEETVQEEKE